jgi:hypothetical protein
MHKFPFKTEKTTTFCKLVCENWIWRASENSDTRTTLVISLVLCVLFYKLCLPMHSVSSVAARLPPFSSASSDENHTLELHSILLQHGL